MHFQISAPVLLIGFNRPDTTTVVFQKIREAKPLKLYVVIDGPREDKEAEKNLVQSVIEIVRKVDWPCETHYHFNNKNVGAEINVSTAISWVLEREEYVIILEDDIVAPLSFFLYAEEMLKKYKDSAHIALVSGCNFTPIEYEDMPDYYFTKYGHIWGWATWRRAWRYFNLYAEINDVHLTKKFLKTICHSRMEIRFYQKKYFVIKQNGIGNSTWDYIANYIFWVNHLLCIVPKVNLTSNIGTHGLHAKGRTENHFRKFDDKFVVKKHPETVEANVRYDRYHFKNYISSQRSLRCFLRIPIKVFNKLFKVYQFRCL